MRLLTILALLISLQSNAQSGSLQISVNFVQAPGCLTTRVELVSDSLSLHYTDVEFGDTISDIPTGLYQVTIYSCDSTMSVGHQVEVVEDKFRRIYYYNGITIDEGDPYGPSYWGDYGYYDTIDYVPFFYLNYGWQFGRGLDYNNEAQKMSSDFRFKYTVGQDFPINESFFALGYEVGFDYNQYNYSEIDFVDSTLVYDKQRFKSFNFSFTLSSSIYIKSKRFMAVGARYSLPMYARIERFLGDDKFSTRKVHNYNEFSAFAQIGYWFAFVYAEYTFNPILIDPYENAPPLTIGLRLNAPIEW